MICVLGDTGTGVGDSQGRLPGGGSICYASRNSLGRGGQERFSRGWESHRCKFGGVRCYGLLGLVYGLGIEYVCVCVCVCVCWGWVGGGG